ncbi:MAG: hypothetical protein FJY20_06180 [Bacteroidetes bacterium]|nr:hypothetical protein [Bacteroidota bacterium]
MGNNTAQIQKASWLHVFFAAGMAIAFFLPWVVWKDSLVNGYYMPSGKFFHIAESKFNLGNLYPQIEFTFYAFWLIPVLAIVTALLGWQKKKTIWPAFITGALTLSLVTVFSLFTKTLIGLGVGNNAFQMLKLPAYLSALFAAGLILTALPAGKWFLRLAFLIAGPLFAFSGFMIINKKVWSETHTPTDKEKTDYTVTAADLILEFAANDTAANTKYREKILVVTGNVAQVETQADSTINIKFVDTSKHFINLSLDKQEYANAKEIKPGDQLSVKGSCSGSTYSMILDSTPIEFKRSTINKTKQQ